ncbi:transmembrane protein [Citrus sinensis]|nr:transmembrane protein [Citrus sinensis]
MGDGGHPDSGWAATLIFQVMDVGVCLLSDAIFPGDRWRASIKAKDRVPYNGKIGISSSKNRCTGKIAISSSNRNDSLQTNQVMASEPADIVLDLVGEKLRRLTATPSDQFNIFKVPDRTRIPLSDYVMAMRALEERARKCYGGSTSLNRDEFVQMMLLDGCFIVEVIRKFRLKHLREDDDPNFKLGWMLPSIARDMILLENQLPYFVIWKLFMMTDMPSDSRNENFLVMILRFFNGILPGKGCRRDIVYQVDVYPINEIKHLAHLIHENWLPSPAGVEAYRNNATNDSYWSFIGSATEIQEAGIHFRKVEVLKDDSLFDIKFENGVMKMPSLEIGDATETILQNL